MVFQFIWKQSKTVYNNNFFLFWWSIKLINRNDEYSMFTIFCCFITILKKIEWILNKPKSSIFDKCILCPQLYKFTFQLSITSRTITFSSSHTNNLRTQFKSVSRNKTSHTFPKTMYTLSKSARFITQLCFGAQIAKFKRARHYIFRQTSCRSAELHTSYIYICSNDLQNGLCPPFFGVLLWSFGRNFG